MKVTLTRAVVFYVTLSISVFATTNPSEEEDEDVPSQYVLSGEVMDDETALELLRRQTELTYQTNMAKYRKELETVAPDMLPEFVDRDFTIVGSLAIVDASVTFYEGIKNLRLVVAEQSAGFPGRPNPTNDKLHNRLQRMNALRNILWLIKEKVKSGVATVDQPLMDKLREAQTWLSTQTGGHLGQGMTAVFEKAGLMDKLKAKWGTDSLKFRTFSAVAANGLDFAINGYNTVVNSIALNQELSKSNILALTSSVTAMAGDITMTVTQILATSAKASAAAGPVGYAIGATLYVASYATGVASGLVDQENLEPKDYVKAFLSPLIPSPSFGALVDMIDQSSKGNYYRAFYISITQTLSAAIYIGGMAVIHALTGSSGLREFSKGLTLLRFAEYIEKDKEFQNLVKTKAGDLVRKLKPKQFLYAFPRFSNQENYLATGWQNSADLQTEFGITSDLLNFTVFLATYSEAFSTPTADCASYANGATFCPDVVDQGDNTLMFLGNNMNEIIIVDKNQEAYGMGGNDTFYVRGWWPGGTIKIDGGEGSDIIDTTLGTIFKNENSEFFLTGGGPEKDRIIGGKANDFVVVENDEVSDEGGNNTFLIRGSGHDVIVTGPGAGLIVVNKTSGATQINPYSWPDENNEKPKRIVFERGSLTTYGPTLLDNKPFVIRGSSTHHDVLFMTNFKPVLGPSSSSTDPLVVLVPDFLYNPADYNRKAMYSYSLEAIKDIYNHLFQDTLCFPESDLDADPPVLCPKANERAAVLHNQIERFELSEHAANLVFIGCGIDRDFNATREIISGSKDLYVIQYLYDSPLIIQMGSGTNRVVSGKRNDAYSLVLDESLDIIYDRGGENLVAVALPEGVTFYDVWLDLLDDEYVLYCGTEEENAAKCFQYIFHGDDDPDAKVQLTFRERTGKEVQFKMLLRPQLITARYLFPPSKTTLIFYFTYYKDTCASGEILSRISPAKGEEIHYGCSLHNPNQAS